MLILMGCQAEPVLPPDAALRHCMILKARTFSKRSENRRPSFDEAKSFARDCDQSKVSPQEVDAFACAFSQQYGKCGRSPPID
jgi:hypothetical protein